MKIRFGFGAGLSSLAALVLCLAPASAQLETTSLKDWMAIESKVQAVAAKALPSTVALLSERSGASGSGVVVSSEGLVLTAAHVIQGAEEMQVIFPNGKQTTGKVLGANYSKDIAMVQLPQETEWPAVEIGKSKDLKAGDWVVSLGHSAGFDSNRPPPVRFGRVVSTGPREFLTTDCTLIGGDSGGPLFDLDGKVIGIHSNIGESVNNNNHSGIEGFHEDWQRLLDGETWGKLALNPFANPEMPVLGIGMGQTRGGTGVVVESVVQDSPAAAAGVRPGDLILSLDGDAIEHGGDLLTLLAKRKAGDRVSLGLMRGKQSLDAEVELMKRSQLFKVR
ncbi:MAG: S1C family serine protease [Akkermansiaceae bacterium]|nr:S1C family serine protease [Akkermansiaceae bacterium]